MKKHLLPILAACLLCTPLQAAIEHGSILKKDLSTTRIQGDGDDLSGEIKVGFKLVSLGGITYAQMDGTGYTLAATAWAAQIRYGSAEMQCPTDNRDGNLCTWSYADPDNSGDVSAVVEDNNNFYQTAAFPYDKTAANSKDANDTAAPNITGTDNTATDDAITFTLTGNDDSGDFFYYLTDEANGLQTVSFDGKVTFSGLMPGSTYTFSITAIDFSGNESATQTVPVTTTGAKPAFDPEANLALNKTATASNSTAGLPAVGNDGSLDTRWRSNSANEQEWWMVNLGAEYVINRVVIRMNGDPGARNATYNIETSLTGAEGSWTTVVTEAAIPAGNGQEYNDHAINPTAARYVRYNGLTKGGWDHNFAEFEVYGTGYYDPTAGTELANVLVSPSNPVNYVGDELQLTATAVAANAMVITDATFTWSVDPAEGASVTPEGIFTATQTGTYTVTATTTVDNITKSGSATVTVEAARTPATLTLTRTMENNINSNWSDVFLTDEAVPFTVTVTDQYGANMPNADVQFDTDGGTLSGNSVSWSTAGTKTFKASVGEIPAQSFTVQVLKATAITSGLTAEASSVNGDAVAGLAVDNNLGSRWISAATAEGVEQAEHLIVKLETPCNPIAIGVVWEGACAATYTIEVSPDGTDYTGLGGETRGNGIVNHTYRVLNNVEAVQYIKINCTVPATGYGYSIYEVIPYVASTTGQGTSIATVAAHCAIYPNPVADVLNIRAESPIARVAVFNLAGQAVLTAEPAANCAAIDCSALPQGSYAVSIRLADGRMTTHKMVK